jgi:hypothetical protein
LGIFSSAAVSLCIFGKRCGHTGLNSSAILIPSHGDGVRVGLNLEWKKGREKQNYINTINVRPNEFWNKKIYSQFSTATHHPAQGGAAALGEQQKK